MRTRVVLAALALGGLAAVAVAVPLVSSSDVANTEIRVAADSPAPAEPAPLPASLRPLWTAPARAAGPGTAPVEGATAVVGGTDRAAGLDPATGRERWSYRRGNARLCSWTAGDGVVIALFAKGSGCRELTALDAATGARRWYRTVEVTTDATLTAGRGVVIVAAGEQLIAVDPGTGLNRWTQTVAGCRLDPAVAGDAAVATVGRCADGVRLVGHDTYADREGWTLPQPAGSDPRVVAAADEIAVLTRSGDRATLTGYRQVEDRNRRLVARREGAVTDPRLAYSDAAAGAATDGQVVALWTGSAVVAVDGRTRRVLWSAPATSPPLSAAGEIVVADATGVTARTVVEGRRVDRCRRARRSGGSGGCCSPPAATGSPRTGDPGGRVPSVRMGG
jgi:outer membrane protein assembly factor BamB